MRDMAEENIVRKRTREEDEQQEEDIEGLPEAKRVHDGPDAGLMAFLDGIDNIYKNEEEKTQNNVLKSPEADEANVKEASTPFLENNNFNFNDAFIDVGHDLETSYFHLCDEDGGLMAVYSTHQGFLPDYTEVNDLCHGGTLWEDDIWQLETNDELFRYT